MPSSLSHRTTRNALLLVSALALLALTLWLAWPAPTGSGAPDPPGGAAPGIAARQPAPSPVASGPEPGARRTTVPDGLLVRVETSAGRTAPGAELFLARDGHCERVEAPRGKARLDPPEGGGWMAARAEDRWSEAQFIESEPPPGERVLTVSRQASRLDVLVTRTDGRPVPSFTVSLRPRPEAGSGAAGRLAELYCTCLPMLRGQDGRARVRGAPPGEFRVTVRSPETVPQEQELLLQPGADASLHFELVPGGFVTGRIVDENNAPLPAARAYARVWTDETTGGAWLPDEFWLEGADPRRFDRADELGRFRVGPLPPGSFRFAATAEARPTMALPRPLQVRPGGQVDVGDLVLGRGAQLEVRIVAAAGGAPIPDARVEYRPDGPEAARYSGTNEWRSASESRTSAGGEILLTGLPVGEVQLRAEAPGYAAGERGVRIRAAPAVNRVRIELPGALGIRGRVVADRSGEPVPGALVVAQPADDAANAEIFVPREASAKDAPHSRTTDQGGFTIEGVGPGRWSLLAEAEGFAPEVHGPFELTAATRDAGRTIRLGRGSSLTVRVLDRHGSPLTGIEVTVLGLDQGGPQILGTDANGVARFACLAPGQYAVSAVLGEGGDPSGSALLGAQQITELLRIEPDADAEIVLGGISNTGGVEGFVEAAGEPLAGLGLMLFSNSYSSTQPTDPSGYYRFEDVPAGDYLFLAGEFGIAGGTGWSDVLTIRGSETVRHDVELPAHDVVVRVREAATSEPLSSIPVVLRLADGAQGGGGFLTTDSEGTARFRFVHAADYVISAGPAAMPFSASRDDYETSLYGPFRVDARAGAETAVAIELRRAAALEGRVLDAAGEPVPGAGVFWLDEQGQPVSQYHIQPTGPDGRFRLEGLPPGPGRVLARHPRRGQVVRRLTLAPNDSNDVSLTLESGVRLRVLALDASGGLAGGVQAALLDETGAPLCPLYVGMQSMMTGVGFLTPGEQVLGPVQPGEYTLLLTRFHGGRMKQRVRVPDGAGELILRIPFQPQ